MDSADRVADRISRALFKCCGCRRPDHFDDGRKLVSSARKTGVDASRLGVWPGLDDTIFTDGAGRLAGLAARWLASGPDTSGLVRTAVGSEYQLVGVILWTAKPWVGCLGDYRVVAGDRGNSDRLLGTLNSSGPVAVALSFLDAICTCAQFQNLATELVIGSTDLRPQDSLAGPRNCCCAVNPDSISQQVQFASRVE